MDDKTKKIKDAKNLVSNDKCMTVLLLETIETKFVSFSNIRGSYHIIVCTLKGSIECGQTYLLNTLYCFKNQTIDIEKELYWKKRNSN